MFSKNPTAIRSRKMIVSSLLELMETQNFLNITIKELCRYADITRPTFYNHFQSKEDIISYYLECISNEWQQNNIDKFDDTFQLANSFFQYYCIENSHNIKLIVNANLIPLIQKNFSLKMQEYLDKCKYFNSSSSEIEKRYKSSFISNGLVGMITLWFSNEQDCDISDLTYFFQNIIK